MINVYLHDNIPAEMVDYRQKVVVRLAAWFVVKFDLVFRSLEFPFFSETSDSLKDSVKRFAIISVTISAE